MHPKDDDFRRDFAFKTRFQNHAQRQPLHEMDNAPFLRGHPSSTILPNSYGDPLNGDPRRHQPPRGYPEGHTQR
jgi:hypothetical protein